jgi:hypothetical protein
LALILGLPEFITFSLCERLKYGIVHACVKAVHEDKHRYKANPTGDQGSGKADMCGQIATEKQDRQEWYDEGWHPACHCVEAVPAFIDGKDGDVGKRGDKPAHMRFGKYDE